MRKYLYLITEHEKRDGRVGGVKVMDSPLATMKKNEERTGQQFNFKEGERYEYKAVSLGHADFEDQDDYEERFTDVVHEKLDEIDQKWLKKAGVRDA